MHTIGFAGTAKNTGKTTCAIRVLEQIRSRGGPLALTSIGYDGEAQDTVTGLPKPRYHLQDGDVVATARECAADIGAHDILEHTDIPTILGEILIIRLRSSSQVSLVGPKRRSEVEKVKSMLDGMGINWFFLDGALNRTLPLLAADGLILSTGAAFTSRLDVLGRHTAAIHRLWQAHRVKSNTWNKRHTNHVTLLGDMVENQQELLYDCSGVVFPADVFEEINKKPIQTKRLIFSSPLHLLNTAPPAEWTLVFSDPSIRVEYIEFPEILFLSANPFFPRYDPVSGKYAPDYVDRADLMDTLRAAAPGWCVIDVEQQPLPDLPGSLQED